MTKRYLTSIIKQHSKKHFYIHPSISLLLILLGFFTACQKENENVIKCTDEEPVWSPDGQCVAYLHDPNDIIIAEFVSIIKSFSYVGCSPARTLIEDRRAGVWVITLENLETIFLTEGSLPDWSPDGKWIAYVKDRNIHKINVETQEIHSLTTWGSCFYPDWSSDNLHIAFSISAGDSAGVYIMDSNGSNLHRVGELVGMQPDWHPEGNILAFIGWIDSIGGIFMADTAGNEIRLIVAGGYAPVFLYSPVFSPDGTKIAYVSDRDGRRNIYVIDTSGQNEIQITDVDWANDPCYSPNGSQIVFSQWDERAQATSLWVMNSDGSEKRRITWPDN